jgi:hypothetical protein
MKKILALLALLLVGCISLPWWGSKDEFEMVPKSANALIILRPSSILNDSDFVSQYNSSQEMEYEMGRVEATTGIDPTKIERLVLFFKFDSFTQESEAYGGFVAKGNIESSKVLEKMRANNMITELKYENRVLYEISSKQSPENKTYMSFLDGNILVGGSRKAVEDCIDLSNGKGESVRGRQKLSRAYDKLERKSLFIFLLESSQNMKREMNESNEELFSIKALSRMESLGFSLDKREKTVDFRLFVLAEDAAGANEITKLFEKSLSIAKGFSRSGSTLESVLARIKLESSGNEVSSSLSSDLDELGKLNDEVAQLTGGIQTPG